MTETLILHHKDVSPYSEKIRLMLGFSDLAWRSVQVPLTPPRPSIDPLINGYRRIPVGQIGADLFCDTRIIAEEVAHLGNKPELNPFNQETHEWLLANHFELDIFPLSFSALSPIGLVKALLQQVKWRKIPGYLKDKKHLFEYTPPEVKSKMSSRSECIALWKSHLNDLEQRLSGNWLTGEQPHYLDFCAVHLIWFRMGMEGKVLFENRPNLESWYQRMIAFGHGQKVGISPSIALEVAKKCNPRPIPEGMVQSSSIGKAVTVGTIDNLLGDTQGKLVGESDSRWIIRRDTVVAGAVHIHFPKTTCRLALI